MFGSHMRELGLLRFFLSGWVFFCKFLRRLIGVELVEFRSFCEEMEEIV